MNESIGLEFGREALQILIEVRGDADNGSKEAAALLATTLRDEHLWVMGPVEGHTGTTFSFFRPGDSMPEEIPIKVTIGKWP